MTTSSTSQEAFDNEDVKTGMQLMMSPDGQAARFIITHEGNAMGPEGIEHVEAFPKRCRRTRGNLGGRREDLHRRGGLEQQGHQAVRNLGSAHRGDRGVRADLPDHAVPLTRSLVAALVIPGTVAFSCAGAFGLSVLFLAASGQGLSLHWLVLPLTFIILVAVGSDCNLLLISWVKGRRSLRLEHRADPSTGQHRRSAVTSAGLVFAFTMLAMLVV